ncbi:MAG: Ribosomal small subunit pseudouridine synthase A [Candidatus Accumulibacter sp. BA-94]|uniref:16S rRNA pseudouridine(516) synthase n=1 Tax=Accumulibacter sp. TaxID=2053492 RepID=UPI00044526E3|nr:16S rRNA pseudouridine(516) synthase [Accumulibacter sp.]EXI88242.1 MAG: Ribosomal small subunit pseudouridine synthase A [Candidatus Accumulibacter sp. BA-94]MBL8390470.1 16S rRNA pseudouridine(516) synthase [Accumulibacter sp.]HRD88585.1 16S rRNA pseudouridine(516) synthase [Accumulibacter sp.]
MDLTRLLQSQGFGSRAECRALIAGGRVSVDGRRCVDWDEQFEAAGLVFCVDGVSWRYHKAVYLALHKPGCYECSHRPQYHRSVYSLLPVPLTRRGVEAVGRLDQDTTGLLLLSDDGAFVHRYTSPRKLVEKVYEVRTRYAVDEGQVQALLAGVTLRDEALTVAAVRCQRLDDRHLRLSVTLGRYHLVKRLLAAVGNRVESLHRVAIGGFVLPPELRAGDWMWLEAADLERLAAGCLAASAGGLRHGGHAAMEGAPGS